YGACYCSSVTFLNFCHNIHREVTQRIHNKAYCYANKAKRSPNGISNKAFKTENLLVKYMSQKAQTKRIRILVSKLGLDGHDRGALVLCRAFRDAGMEVIYSGLFATPERIAQIVEDEDIDVVALSLLNGAHLTLFPRVAKAIKDKGINDVLVIGGGVIPEDDKPALEKSGVLGNFGPGTPLPSIIDFIQTNLSKK